MGEALGRSTSGSDGRRAGRAAISCFVDRPRSLASVWRARHLRDRSAQRRFADRPKEIERTRSGRLTHPTALDPAATLARVSQRSFEATRVARAEVIDPEYLRAVKRPRHF